MLTQGSTLHQAHPATPAADTAHAPTTKACMAVGPPEQSVPGGGCFLTSVGVLLHQKAKKAQWCLHGLLSSPAA